MPKADATGLAPKKSAAENPPAHSPVLEGFWLSLPLSLLLLGLILMPFLHFFGEVSERRPWASNAKTARPLLPGAPNAFLRSAAPGYRLAYTGEYPIPPSHIPLSPSARQAERNLRNQPDTIVRLSGEKIVLGYSLFLQGFDTLPLFRSGNLFQAALLSSYSCNAFSKAPLLHGRYPLLR